jgi:hypothetical protein
MHFHVTHPHRRERAGLGRVGRVLVALALLVAGAGALRVASPGLFVVHTVEAATDYCNYWSPLYTTLDSVEMTDIYNNEVGIDSLCKPIKNPSMRLGLWLPGGLYKLGTVTESVIHYGVSASACYTDPNVTCATNLINGPAYARASYPYDGINSPVTTKTL